mgnify:CR=1 FL=1
MVLFYYFRCVIQCRILGICQNVGYKEKIRIEGEGREYKKDEPKEADLFERDYYDHVSK